MCDPCAGWKHGLKSCTTRGLELVANDPNWQAQEENAYAREDGHHHISSCGFWCEIPIANRCHRDQSQPKSMGPEQWLTHSSSNRFWKDSQGYTSNGTLTLPSWLSQKQFSGHGQKLLFSSNRGRKFNPNPGCFQPVPAWQWHQTSRQLNLHVKHCEYTGRTNLCLLSLRTVCHHDSGHFAPGICFLVHIEFKNWWW